MPTISRYLSSPLVPLPAAAAGVTVTSSTTPWANSSWVEITSSLSSDSLLAAIHALTADTNEIQFEVDIGVGAASSEVVISTVKGLTHTVLSDIGEDISFVLPILIDALSSGDRVAARIRTNASSAIDWKISISVVAKPYTGSLLTTANPIKVLPSAAAFANPVSHASTAWLNGSYVEIVASLPTDIVLVGLAAKGATRNEWDIAKGGSGSEVVKTTHRGHGQSMNNQTMLSSPLDVFSSGDRIAARARSTSAFVTLPIALMYIEKPL